MSKAFSLVELSIVLVILGLLTGGILSGQSLIRAAELRSVIDEAGLYQAAVKTFYDRNNGLPGDLKNGTAFWGDNNSECPDAAVANGTPGTCNGDGDGMIEQGAGANVTGEMFQFWNQLALDGLIAGTYSGKAGASGVHHCVIDTNVPHARMSRGAWGILYKTQEPDHATTNEFYIPYNNNVMFFGAVSTSMPGNAILKPTEAWNIDTKIDDGKPAYGRVMPRTWACSDASSSTDFDSEYRVNTDSVICAVYFLTDM